MKVGITPLIAENIAPSTATKISIFNGDNKVCDVDISKMKPQNLGTKLYSFGLISDIHLTGSSTNDTRFDNVLTYFENQNCAFCCHSGDMTNIGFYMDSTEEYTAVQFGKYKEICDDHPNLPVYSCCGNHDSYTKAITNNLDDLQTYTGHPLQYVINYQNDVFIFVGQSTATLPMSDTQLTWLQQQLSNNSNKRCFVFVHPFLSNDSGNPYGLYANKLFDWWGTNTTTFVNMMKQYDNAMLFHGHSHMRPDMQKEVKNTNFSTSLGFKSMHVPSTAGARYIVNGDTLQYTTEESYGYVVDVYDNCIILKGIDFITNTPVIIAQYKINIGN